MKNTQHLNLKAEGQAIKHCPFCSGQNLKMNKVKRTGISYKDKKVVKGIFDVWECQDCKESFFHNWILTKDGKKL